MEIIESAPTAKYILSKIQKKLAKDDRTGHPWHASELFACPRKSILGRETKRTYTERDMLYFIRGYAIQEYIFDEEEDGTPVLGVIYSPDHVEGDNVFEMKTTNFWYLKATADEFHTFPVQVEVYDKKADCMKMVEKFAFDPRAMGDWCQRTLAYCVSLGKSKGHIVVYFMNGTDGPDLKAWDLTWTAEEMQDMREEIDARKIILDNFWEVRQASTRWSDLPPVTLRTYPKECGFCPIKPKCLKELIRHKLEVA